MLAPHTCTHTRTASCRSYINGKPFVVREAERPFSNLEYTGIDRQRLESMEARLKQDVLQEVGEGCGGALGRGQWRQWQRLLFRVRPLAQ